MNALLGQSVYFGAVITLASYFAGVKLKKRFQSALCNPVLISIIITIVFLLVCGIDYEIYSEGAKYISYLLTPATVCLAIPLYEQFHVLKQNKLAILAGIIAGSLTSMISVLVLCLVLKLSHTEYVTLLPKSVTTAISMPVANELGGLGAVTAAVVIVTGIIGNVSTDAVCRLFKITEPVAKGVAIGTSSHAIGTARALEMGETEGAVSSLSIVAAGIFTVIAVNLFQLFL